MKYPESRLYVISKYVCEGTCRRDQLWICTVKRTALSQVPSSNLFWAWIEQPGGGGRDSSLPYLTAWARIATPSDCGCPWYSGARPRLESNHWPFNLRFSQHITGLSQSAASSLWTLELICLRNHVSQNLIITQLTHIHILLVLFLWKTLTNTHVCMYACVHHAVEWLYINS
jgi:hypothetical protein